MTTKEERADARAQEARAAAALRARQLEDARAIIDEEKQGLLTQLRELRERETDPALLVSELPAVRREVQLLTITLYHAPFHVPVTELAEIVGRHRSKIWDWDARGYGNTPEAAGDE